MKWLKRLRTLAQVVMDDVLGEDADPAGHASPNTPAAHELAEMLAQAQSQLDTLRLELAQAQERQKRLTAQGQTASAQAQSLDASVDTALKAGQEDRAADLLKKMQRMSAYAQELEALRQESEQLTLQLKEAVETRQDQLTQLRLRAQALTDREHAAELLESLLTSQRTLARQTDDLSKAFQAREEQITHREDRLAARQEWSQ